MFCPRCGQPLPPNVAFCMHCGQAVVAPQVERRMPAPVVTPAAPASDKKWMLPTAIGLLVLIGLLLGAGALLMTRAKAQPANLRAAAAGSPAPLQANFQGMPDDIHAWLEHLKETELRRRKLTSKEMTDFQFAIAEGTKALLNDVGNPDSRTDPNHPPNLDAMAKVATQAKQDWSELTDFFNSKAPPTECVPIRNEFDETIRETGAEIGDVIGVLAGGEADPEGSKRKLQAMSDTSEKSIDKHGEATDALVAQICNKYHTAKWFDIKGDIGGGTLQGAVGIPMPSANP
jgi:hypothetical protein